MSIARTTPAQNPRGWARITFIKPLHCAPAGRIPPSVAAIDSTLRMAPADSIYELACAPEGARAAEVRGAGAEKVSVVHGLGWIAAALALAGCAYSLLAAHFLVRLLARSAAPAADDWPAISILKPLLGAF